VTRAVTFGLVVTALVASVAAARAPIPYPPQSATLRALEPPVFRSVRDGTGPVLLRRDDTAYAGSLVAGVALDLERHHVPVLVDARDAPLAALFTPSRVSRGERVRAVLTLSARRRAPAGSGTRVASAGGVTVLRAPG
jgi:hypothetical protein